MWPFGRRKVVTSTDFTKALLDIMQRNAKELLADLEGQTAPQWQLTPDEIATLGHEVFIAHLWAVSNVLALDKQLLDLLHRGYLSGFYNKGHSDKAGADLANAAKAEANQRYEKYYKAWNEDMKANGGVALSSEMANFFFPKRRPVLDFLLCYMIQKHIGALMINTLEVRKSYNIVAT